MAPIRLHDTRSGKLRDLVPGPGGRVGIYACGPTVYDRIHVGNARPFVVFSLLRRFLVHEGLAPRLVINVTDVNDKIYVAAAARGVPSAELAAEMTDAYVRDTDKLGLGRPDAEPLATETIGPIVALIGDLIENGHAYAAGGDVYFGVRTYSAYGELSHRELEDLDQGEERDRKRDPLDFALWKGAKPEEDIAWDAAWGRGRPGWHIECSAMAEAELGVGFEIHGGGSDLVFPHHENEAAQTGAARGWDLAQIWMHNGMVRLEQEKMAKSQGNAFALHRALEEFGAETLVMYLCGGHYRQPLAFSDERLAEARARCAGIRDAVRRLPPGPTPSEVSLAGDFFAALAHDFNTPAALAVLAEQLRRLSTAGAGRGVLSEMLEVLGLETLLVSEEAPPEVRALAESRARAREERDWTAADRLRDEIAAAGWTVRDGPEGPELVPA
jgi:cysteinyl-tRNA synthetase